jgi:ABC-2 type transport system permease protein
MADTVRSASGAIHDIGYRRYDGPRQSAGATFGTLVWHGLRGSFGFGRALRAKAVPFLLLGAAVAPALIIVMASTLTNGVIDVRYADYLGGVQVLLAIWIALAAPQLVARDLRFRTTSLYFARPLGRARYVVARAVSGGGALFAFCAIPLLVIFLGKLLGQADLTDELKGLLPALGYAVLVSVLLCLLALAISSFATRRGMGTVAIIVVLILLPATSGILAEVTRDGGHETLRVLANLISPFEVSVRSAMVLFDFSPASADAVKPDGLTGWIAWFAACCGVLALRYRRESVL